MEKTDAVDLVFAFLCTLYDHIDAYRNSQNIPSLKVVFETTPYSDDYGIEDISITAFSYGCDDEVQFDVSVVAMDELLAIDAEMGYTPINLIGPNRKITVTKETVSVTDSEDKEILTIRSPNANAN